MGRVHGQKGFSWVLDDVPVVVILKWEDLTMVTNALVIFQDVWHVPKPETIIFLSSIAIIIFSNIYRDGWVTELFSILNEYILGNIRTESFLWSTLKEAALFIANREMVYGSLHNCFLTINLETHQLTAFLRILQHVVYGSAFKAIWKLHLIQNTMRPFMAGMSTL